jgi:hypothetical protein
MRIIALFSCLYALLPNSVLSQRVTLNTPMEFLTFRQVRLVPAASFDIGTYYSHASIGKLPESLELKRDSIAGPLFYNIGLWLDLTSPHSRLSFAVGGSINYLSMVMEEKKTGLRNELSAGQLQIPFMVKYMFGKKFVAVNPIFFIGGSYNIPISFSNGTYLVEKQAITTNYSLQSGIAGQYNFRGKDKKTYSTNTGSRKVALYAPRIWIFLKATYTNTNLFNVNFNQKIIQNTSNSTLDYRDLRFTAGAAAFFGSNKKYKIKNN